MTADLEKRIQKLEDENAVLKQRIADLELQMAQVTERALRMNSSCSTCGH